MNGSNAAALSAASASSGSSSTVKVVFVGASRINFGGLEGLWNHATRIELILGSRLQVVGIVDPDIPRCERILAEKQASATVGSSYAGAKAFSSIDRLLQGCAPADCAIVGCPPMGAWHIGADSDR